MNNTRICVIGSSNLDLYVNAGTNLMEDVSLCGKISFAAGGVGRNISASLAALKIKNDFISVFSNDVYGKFLLDSINEEFICIENSILNADKCPMYCDILVADNHFGINDTECTSRLTPEFFSLKKEQLEKMDYLIFDLNISNESIDYLLNNIKSRWICDATSVIKCNKLGSNISKLYTLKANYYEALEITGLTSKSNIEYIIDTLLYQGVQEIYITLGSEGAIFANCNDKIYMKHKIPIHGCNTVGAGDVFLAAVIYSNLLHYDIYKTLAYAIKLSYSFIKMGVHQLNNDTQQDAQQIEEQDILALQWSKKMDAWMAY